MWQKSLKRQIIEDKCRLAERIYSKPFLIVRTFQLAYQENRFQSAGQLIPLPVYSCVSIHKCERVLSITVSLQTVDSPSSPCSGWRSPLYPRCWELMEWTAVRTVATAPHSYSGDLSSAAATSGEGSYSHTGGCKVQVYHSWTELPQ